MWFQIRFVQTFLMGKRRERLGKVVEKAYCMKIQTKPFYYQSIVYKNKNDNKVLVCNSQMVHNILVRKCHLYTGCSSSLLWTCLIIYYIHLLIEIIGGPHKLYCIHSKLESISGNTNITQFCIHLSCPTNPNKTHFLFINK